MAQAPTPYVMRRTVHVEGKEGEGHIRAWTRFLYVDAVMMMRRPNPHDSWLQRGQDRPGRLVELASRRGAGACVLIILLCIPSRFSPHRAKVGRRRGLRTDCR